MQKNLSITFLCAVIFLLSACEQVTVCAACIKSDPASPVAVEDYSKIRFSYAKISLPDNVNDVYYYETCGLDCRFFARFRMQYEDAISFAGNIRDIEKFRGFRDRPDPNVIDWWPKKIPSSAIGSSGDINVKDDPYVDIAVVKDGQSADVFLYSWTM